MSTLKLAAEIVRMANTHEKSWVSEPDNSFYLGHYEIDIIDMQNDNEWSFPAYLLLIGTWNDALDWATNIILETGEEKIAPFKTPPELTKI